MNLGSTTIQSTAIMMTMLSKTQHLKASYTSGDTSTHFHYLVEVGDGNIYLSVLFSLVIPMLMTKISLDT